MICYIKQKTFKQEVTYTFISLNTVSHISHPRSLFVKQRDKSFTVTFDLIHTVLARDKQKLFRKISSLSEFYLMSLKIGSQKFNYYLFKQKKLNLKNLYSYMKQDYSQIHLQIIYLTKNFLFSIYKYFFYVEIDFHQKIEYVYNLK